MRRGKDSPNWCFASRRCPASTVPSDPHPLEPPPAAGLGDVPEARLRTGATLERIHLSKFGPIFFGKKERVPLRRSRGRVRRALRRPGRPLRIHRNVWTRAGQRRNRAALRAARSISTLIAARELKLADLRGHHLAQLRIDSKISSYTDYDVTQRWSRAFFEHAQSLDGLIFHSRHDPLRHGVALFERGGP